MVLLEVLPEPLPPSTDVVPRAIHGGSNSTGSPVDISLYENLGQIRCKHLALCSRGPYWFDTWMNGGRRRLRTGRLESCSKTLHTNRGNGLIYSVDSFYFDAVRFSSLNREHRSEQHFLLIMLDFFAYG